jgi:hypothetical protein
MAEMLDKTDIQILRVLQKNARITLVSATSIVEGGYHDVILKTANKREGI